MAKENYIQNSFTFLLLVSNNYQFKIFTKARYHPLIVVLFLKNLESFFERHSKPGPWHTYLPTMAVNVTLHVHTNCTCALIQNGKLRFMIK